MTTDSRASGGDHITNELRINDRIRVPEVRLVDSNGEQVGIVAIADAIRRAEDEDLDLVEIAPTARPPVCKIMDYGKFKYESAQKAREARRNQTLTVIKEMKLRPKIDPHDYATKKGHVVRFLKAGDKVKITIMFRGREQSRPELGYRLLERLAGEVSELGVVEASPKQDGRNMTMVIAPHRNAVRPSRGDDEAPVHDDVSTHESAPEPTRSAAPVPVPAAAAPVPAAAAPVVEEIIEPAHEPVTVQPVTEQPVVPVAETVAHAGVAAAKAPVKAPAKAPVKAPAKATSTATATATATATTADATMDATTDATTAVAAAPATAPKPSAPSAAPKPAAPKPAAPRPPRKAPARPTAAEPATESAT